MSRVTLTLLGCWGALACSTSVRAEGLGAESSTLVVPGRAPAVLLVVVPKGAAPGTPTAAVLAALDDALRGHTGLSLVPAERGGLEGERLDPCARDRRYACWTEAAAPELRALFIASLLPLSAARERLELSMLDLAAARRCRAAAGDGAEAVEDCIYAGAVRSEPVVLAVGDPEALAHAAERFVAEDLRPRLEALELWSPYATLLVETSALGAELGLDGVSLGLVATPRVRLLDVRPGERRVSLAAADGARADTVVAARRGEEARVQLDILRAPRLDPSGRAVRAALRYGGAGLALAGAALVIAGAVEARGVRTRCLFSPSAPEAPCPELGLATFGGDSGATPALSREAVRPAGLAIVPVGAALGAAGATWFGWSWLADDEPRSPWLAVALGVGAGALAFGLGAALEPR